MLSRTLLFALSNTATVLAHASFDSIVGFSQTLSKRQDNSSVADPALVYLSTICNGIDPYSSEDDGGAPPADHMNLPCNIVYTIIVQCTQGAAGDSLDELSPVDQRNCICGSQFWDALTGCRTCFEKHGGGAIVGAIGLPDASAISSASSDYCAASAMPTADFFSHYGYLEATSSVSTTDASFSDPLGSTATEVSYYWTPKVSDPASVPYATVTPAASDATTSAKVDISVITNSAGQIVPTEAAAVATSGATTSGDAASSKTSTNPSSSPSTGLAVAATVAPVVKQAAAGMLALVGVVALL